MLKHTLALAATLALAQAAFGDEPIRTLLVTGHNNHNWQYTSRVHAETLESTGRFAVTVTDDPATALAAKPAQPWQLFVLDYNDSQAAKRWGEAAEKSFVKAVGDGAGVVAIHSSNNAFAGWKEYEQMLGLMWREGTGHGKFHTFTVSTVDANDPIMAGLPTWFETNDELYHKLVNSQNAKYHLLAEAMSAKETGGTGEKEPMAFTLQFGNGRVFATPLGHVWNGSDDQKTSITNPNFRILLCRGAEWAATGSVSFGKEWKPTAADAAANTLTDAEKLDGWALLFDGKTSANFRGYKKTEFPKDGWVIADGILKHEGGKGGGDIVTTGEYDDFELMIDWRVAEGGNSGVIYRCTEDHDYPWQTGPEMQVLDDAHHNDGKKPRTRAGTLYDVVACAADVSRPAGEWNHARLVANGTKIEHWLNGFKVVDIDTSSDAYKKAVAESKWKDAKDYNSRKKGHIDLQDHGDTVEYRNIKIRRSGAPNPAVPTPASRESKAGALTHGPFPGHCTPDAVTVWARGAAPGAYRMWLCGENEALVATVDAKATEDNDLCMTFHVGALPAGRTFTARVSAVVNPSTAEKPLPGAGSCSLATAPDPNALGSTTIVFGSCTNDYVDRVQPIWEAVAGAKPDVLCLIGDTPYIDSTDLAVQRAKYGNLFAVRELAALRQRGTVVYGVWDDHDFGKNDTDGRLAGKENSRRVFAEYHPNARLGDGGAGSTGGGVYSSFRRGPVEVFLLDARWFSNKDTRTLLGEAQWQWLLDGLHTSHAPFKIVVTGMVWNDAVRPDKTDYWGYYPKERQRFIDAVRSEKIDGVILVGGDIHRSRALRTHPYNAVFPREPMVGEFPYTLYEWTSSPLGASVQESWNVPGPSLVWDRGEPHAFMAVTTEQGGGAITARWIDGTGREMFRQRVTAEELTVKPGVVYKPSPAATPASRGGGWEQRHRDIVASFAPPQTQPDGSPVAPAPHAGRLVFLGDSITEGWAGQGKGEWASRFASRGGVNAGIGGDRTEHVLWRLDNGLIKAMRDSKTKLVVLMIGTNNSNGGDHSAAEIAEGVSAIVDRVTVEVADAKVLLLGVFPRSPRTDFQRRKVADVNALISRLDGKMAGRVTYMDIGTKFLDKDGWAGELPAEIMPDYLHLSTKGYTVWADAIEAKVAELLGEKK
jgi:alkaline phosphatase D